MTRDEAEQAVYEIIGNFCVDDVVGWTANFCREQAEQFADDGATTIAARYDAVANALINVKNEGI
jgi:hypothetical protein